jgi:hypothetical protein
MNSPRCISLALIGLPLAFAAACGDSTTPASTGTSSGAGTTTGSTSGASGSGSGSVTSGAGGTGMATTGSMSSGVISAGTSSGSVSAGSGSGAGSGSSGSSSGAGGTGSSSGAGDGGTEGGGGCKTDPGTALEFTSTVPDLVQASIANMPAGKASRTIELWAYFDGTGNSWRDEHGLFETGDQGPAGGAACHEFALNSTATQGVLHPYGNCDPVDNFFVAPTNAFPGGATKTGWIHIAFAYDMTNNAFLFTINGNGMLMNQGAVGARMHTEGWPAPANWSTTQYTAADAMKINANALTGNVLSIGTTPQFVGPTGWGGRIDELRVWSVFRDAATIKANMNVMLKGTETGLVAYYKFDEGMGTTIADVTGDMTNNAKMVLAGATQPTWPKWVKSDIPGPFTCAQ